MNKSSLLMSAALGMLSAFALPAFAGTPLSAEELKALITGKTLDVLVGKTGKVSVIYESPDGAHNVLTPTGQRFTGKWWVNDIGQHCVESPGLNGCYHIVNNNGVYQKMDADGNVTHTIQRIRDGDQR